MDTYKRGQYDELPLLQLDEVNPDTIIIISVYSPKNAVNIYTMLRQKGFLNLFWYINLRGKIRKRTDFFQDECVDLRNWGDCILPHLEIHISDKCNLNCQACTHFSPLFNEIGDDFDAQIRGLMIIRELFSCVGRIDILGGEPFLNNKIQLYLSKIRELFPYSYIQVFSNGLLIPKVDESIFEIMEKERISISISEYKPTHMMKAKICGVLDENYVRYKIMEFNRKQKFNKPISLKENSKYPHLCISNGCVTIKNDLIARCPTLMYIDRFNEVFGTSLPMDGIYKVDEFISGVDLLEKMEEEVPLCKHCVKCEIDWKTCDREKRIEDFAVLE